MKQSIMYSTMAVLGTVTIGSISAFAIYFNKYKDNDKALTNINNNKKFVAITVIPDTDPTHEVIKLYDLKDDEKTLVDVMKHHPTDFHLRENKFLLGVLGRDASTSAHEFWSIESLTYTSHHPSSLSHFSPEATRAGMIESGISEIQLTYSENFKIRLSHWTT